MSVFVPGQLPDVFVSYQYLVDGTDIKRLVNLSNASGCRHIDITVGILRNGPHRKRFQPVLNPEHPRLAFVNHGNAGIIRAYPETVFAVHEKAHNACNTGCGIHTFKGIAVIPDQSAVAADPDKAFRGLRNRVGFRSRKSVPVVIKHSRVPGPRSRRVHRGKGSIVMIVRIPGESYASYSRETPENKNKTQAQAYHGSVIPCLVSFILHMCGSAGYTAAPRYFLLLHVLHRSESNSCRTIPAPLSCILPHDAKNAKEIFISAFSFAGDDYAVKCDVRHYHPAVAQQFLRNAADVFENLTEIAVYHRFHNGGTDLAVLNQKAVLGNAGELTVRSRMSTGEIAHQKSLVYRSDELRKALVTGLYNHVEARIRKHRASRLLRRVQTEHMRL